MKDLLNVTLKYEEPKWYFTSSNDVWADYIFESKVVEEPFFIVKMSEREAKKAKLKGKLINEIQASNFVILMLWEEVKQYSNVIPEKYYKEIYDLVQEKFYANEKWF